MPKLIVGAGTPQAQEFDLHEGENFLGSDATNHFQLEDVSISGSHAQIVVTGNSAVVTDLGSTNGTFIDREPISESVIQSGQILRLGGVELLYKEDAVPKTDVVVEQLAPASSQGLRIAGGATLATSPSLSSPPLARPIPPPVAQPQPNGNATCKIHRKSVARWACPRCGNSFCDVCVNSRRLPSGGSGYFCRPCGVQCSPLQVTIAVHPLKTGNFYSQLPAAFLYPFQNGGAFLLFCATVFLVVLEFIKGRVLFGFFLQILYFGYLFAYMQNIVSCTVLGDGRKPDLPEITNVKEDFLDPCLQLIGTVVLCFGPALVLMIWGNVLANPDMWFGVIPMLILGCLYFPMAFLAVAMFDTIAAINPMLIVPSILRVSLPYLTACSVLALVFVVRWLGDVILPMVIPVMIVPTIISSFLGLYFLTVQCRILGLLYMTNKERLGWFNF